MGRGGLRKVEIEGKHITEIGYMLLPEHWGKGYATEITAASVNVAFELWVSSYVRRPIKQESEKTVLETQEAVKIITDMRNEVLLLDGCSN